MNDLLGMVIFAGILFGVIVATKKIMEG